MLAQAVHPAACSQGLRPFDPLRDMAAAADLIEQVFGEQQPFTGQAIIDEMRRWARSMPLLLLLWQGDALPMGFVWEERGRLVGNVSLSRLTRSGADWLISNVAVDTAYRQRGIGRCLVRAAINEARRAGGENALLQVRTDNPVAQRLYHSLGFHRIYTTVEMQCPVENRQPIVAPPDLTARRFRLQDRRRVRNIMLQPVPYHLHRFAPLLVSGLPMTMDTDLGGWLDDWLAKRRRYRSVLQEGEQVIGFVGVQRQKNPSYFNQLVLAVHAAQVGAHELNAARQGLQWLNRWLGQPVVTSVPASATESLTALRELGFEPIRKLDQMRLHLNKG